MLPAAEPAGAFRSPREGPNLEGLRRIDGRHLAFSTGPGEPDNDVQIHVPERKLLQREPAPAVPDNEVLLRGLGDEEQRDHQHRGSVAQMAKYGAEVP